MSFPKEYDEDIEDLWFDGDQAISSPDLAGTDVDLDVTEGVSSCPCRAHRRSLSPPVRLPCRGDSWLHPRAIEQSGAAHSGTPDGYRRSMQDAAEIWRRKRRSNRAVLVGVIIVGFALLGSSLEVAPMLVTTILALVGMVLVMYGVHVGWLVFFDREPDGPSS